MDIPYGNLMDRRTRDQWVQLTTHVLRARSAPSSCTVNQSIETAADHEPHAPVSPAYRLWIADNFARDGHFTEAARAYDATVNRSQLVTNLPNSLDPTVSALYHKAQALALGGNLPSAIDAFSELGGYASTAKDAFLQAGLLAERSGDPARAADLYSRVAASAFSARTDDAAQMCRRALLRIRDAGTLYFASQYRLKDALTAVLENGDTRQLERLVSRTHFAIGPLGGHTAFETEELAQELARDLTASRVSVKRALLGSGEKLYLPTSGWHGRWFQGDVAFILTKAPQGWQWTGLGLSSTNDRWLERWRPTVKQTNSPLPFELVAPWPEWQHFKAGGLWGYVAEQALIVSAGFLGGGLIALGLSGDDCGFGPRGYYYNTGPTHDGDEAFAIDFTRYKQWVPYDNVSGGTPVLAARSGIVRFVAAGTPSGDSSASNTVEISHADPANLADLSRFTSRYLHMEGPFKILVSAMMPVFVGNRLGLMDDTGNSVLDHLHFCIHDRQILFPGVDIGGSVRPTPMSGVTLEDGDDGTCVRSTNVEIVGEKPVKEISTYAVQNWLITPSALSVNEQIPGVRDQRFLLILSGVAIVDVKGNSSATWLHETVSLRPLLYDALNYAVNRWHIPTPGGSAGSTFGIEFETEQWAPFVSLSSVFNQNESINSGFAVDAWRLNPFGSANDAMTNQLFNRLFAGIQVDIAVRDTDAWIFRLGYNIALLGRIVYVPIIIT
ncbi:MAG TPA: M23 family metallopeptidase [Casimicrobiaceae bacterium]